MKKKIEQNVVHFFWISKTKIIEILKKEEGLKIKTIPPKIYIFCLFFYIKLQFILSKTQFSKKN